MPRMTRSLSPSVGNKGQILVEELYPQAAAASCTYKRRKEHKHTSAPYKLAIAHMQAAGEWRSWLAPHVRIHVFIHVCVLYIYVTTVIYLYRLGIYNVYIRGEASHAYIPRHKPRARGRSRNGQNNKHAFKQTIQ